MEKNSNHIIGLRSVVTSFANLMCGTKVLHFLRIHGFKIQKKHKVAQINYSKSISFVIVQTRSCHLTVFEGVTLGGKSHFSFEE